MRTHYRNGDEITRQHTGCDGCSPCMVNGVLCHEYGCPYAWRDEYEDVDVDEDEDEDREWVG